MNTEFQHFDYHHHEGILSNRLNMTNMINMTLWFSIHFFINITFISTYRLRFVKI